jgi:hypothetical protein
MTPTDEALHQAELASRYAYGDKPDDMREAVLHALAAIVALAKGQTPERLC